MATLDLCVQWHGLIVRIGANEELPTLPPFVSNTDFEISCVHRMRSKVLEEYSIILLPIMNN